MSNFVYNLTALPGTKTDQNPLSGPVNESCQASEFNDIMSASYDMRGAILDISGALASGTLLYRPTLTVVGSGSGPVYGNGWISASFFNQSSGVWMPPAFYRDRNRLYFAGAAYFSGDSTASLEPIFTLPSTFRPSYPSDNPGQVLKLNYLPTVLLSSSNVAGVLVVASNGQVIWGGDAFDVGVVCLEGLSFMISGNIP